MVAQILTHGRFAFLQVWKDKSMWLKVLLMLPLAEVLPLLLVGRAFLSYDQLQAFLFTNLAWCFVASVIMQCLYVFQSVTQSAKLDLLIAADGGLAGWVVGYCGMTSLVYMASAAVSCGLLGLGLGYPVSPAALLVAIGLVVPAVLALMAVVLGLCLRWARILHLVNSTLDVLQVLACVMYPLAALPAILRPAAVLTPLMWVNQYLWTGQGWTLLVALGLCLVALVAAFAWMRRCVARYRRLGNMGRSR
ncbi:MAG: hypothetical protein LBV06_08210 [Propionibacteriaceae bacterium]|jgi:ABC-2 type transport system permease protein|nr:hypothetical protein [Propionibacteriaceae bacterium]